MNDTKISIITVCYNAEQDISRTMESVLSQDYQYIEYLIIDGKSKDKTVEVINNYIQKYPSKDVKLISEPDKGIYDAMNKGLALATGKWVNFMNAGDYFYSSDTISHFIQIVKDDTIVAFGDTAISLNKCIYKRKSKPFYEHLPLHQEIGFYHQSSFVKLNIAQQYKFDLKYTLAADYKMFITLYNNGCKFQQLNYIIAYYDLNGASAKNYRKCIKEKLEIENPNNKLNTIISYCKYLKILFKKICISLLDILNPKIMYFIRSKQINKEIVNEKKSTF